MPSRRTLAVAFCGYVLVALVATWPLALHLFTHLPGPRSGDTGVYAWNLWVFRHEVVDHRWPFWTSSILSLTPPTDLSLHNYTLVANVLALPLLPWVGLVGTYNLILLLFLVLDGWCLFVLARRVTGRPLESWVAGAMFAASPALIARTTAHLSLVGAFPLPLVALATIRLLSTWRARDAVVAGAAVALAAACDAYYGVYAVLLVIGFAVGCRVRIAWERREASWPWRAARRTVGWTLALVLAGVVAIATSDGIRLEVLGARIVAETLYTPVLLATTLAGLLVLLVWRPRLVGLDHWSLHAGRVVRLVGAAVVTTAVLLSPVLVAAARRAAAGDLDLPPTYWRSSPPGVDLLAFAMPNPNHPWFGAPFRAWLARDRADGFPEYVAAVPLTALAVIAWAVWRRSGALPRPWLALAIVFALLALGPFIHVGGTNTFVPGPWAVLRYVPFVGLARSPARFALVVAMLASVVFAFALAVLRDRGPRRLVTALVLLGVGVELLPSPRPLSAAAVPAIYYRIASDPDPRVRVLELPTGVRDGASSIGDFSARTQFFQTVHGKRLIGGYLSRVPRRQKRALSSLPVLSALIALSEGRPLTPEAEYDAWRARHRFLARARVGYVVIDTSRAPRALRDFAIQLLDLEPIAADMGFELYRPRRRASPPRDPPFRGFVRQADRSLSPPRGAPRIP